jgi:nucleoid-associated protein YgaU
MLVRATTLVNHQGEIIMARIAHGMPITTDAAAVAGFDDGPVTGLEAVDALELAAVPPPDFKDFDYLFPTLQGNPDALLPDGDTPKRLKALAATMTDNEDEAGDSNIPAAYTYFGQFVDHDITLEEVSGPPSTDPGKLLSDDLTPLSLNVVQTSIRNTRTATFDLDSVYGGEAAQPPVPRDSGDANKLLVGHVSPTSGDPGFQRPPGKGPDNDVPPQGRNPGDSKNDRAARIGDPRNDENTIIAQLQVAFLKAHNELVKAGHPFEQARRILRQHYQHIVIDDFLRRIADTSIVDDILANGNRFYNALAEPFFLPLEFSVAAYRFGHTMVRASYDFNINFDAAGNAPGGAASLELLFTFTALSGDAFGSETLPENWIIEWENIIGDDIGHGGRARKFDTRLSAKIGNAAPQALFSLRSETGAPLPDLAKVLAARNLLRGYMLRMPTGQAVASLLGINALTAAQLKAAAGPDQAAALEAGGFLERTPLWFYVLAESAHHGGKKLGPVGSTIVAGVLIGLVRRSDDSILRAPGWTPSLPTETPGHFGLADLLRFAKVLPGGAEPRIHVVAAGETLFGIAEEELGDGSRWPEIFAANRNVIRRFDLIVPGMRLMIPSGPAPVPQLRFIIVKPGDTLSALAREHLGDANRWPEIFALNGGVLTNPNRIVVGQVLQLPGQ